MASYPRASSARRICVHLPDTWAYVGSNDPDAVRHAEARQFGIAADSLTDAVVWLSARLEDGEPIGSCHSWLCHGIEAGFYEATGIRPNADGFLTTQHEAEQCLAYINANKAAR